MERLVQTGKRVAAERQRCTELDRGAVGSRCERGDLAQRVLERAFEQASAHPPLERGDGTEITEIAEALVISEGET